MSRRTSAKKHNQNHAARPQIRQRTIIITGEHFGSRVGTRSANCVETPNTALVSEDGGHAKVGNFEIRTVVQENILRLQIAMRNALSVQVFLVDYQRLAVGAYDTGKKLQKVIVGKFRVDANIGFYQSINRNACNTNLVKKFAASSVLHGQHA